MPILFQSSWRHCHAQTWFRWADGRQKLRGLQIAKCIVTAVAIVLFYLPIRSAAEKALRSYGL